MERNVAVLTEKQDVAWGSSSWFEVSEKEVSSVTKQWMACAEQALLHLLLRGANRGSDR
jgi:hypothetical protein